MVQNIAISDLLNQPGKNIPFWVDRFDDMPKPDNLVFQTNTISMKFYGLQKATVNKLLTIKIMK